MRVRIAVPVLTGALALGFVAVPTAAFATTAKPVITKAVSPSTVLGLGGTITLGATVTATDASGIKAIYAEPYPLALVKEYGGAPTAAELTSDPADDLLKVKSSTATSQTAGVLQTDKIPTSAKLPNDLAGTWGVAVLVVANDGSTTFNVKAATFNWRRADKLTAKVSATRVRKGANLTVKGQLNRVNWTKHAYQGYGAQPVLLEFRKTGSSTWTKVKQVRSSKTGAVSATVKDNAGGSWRFVFVGNSTSGSVSSAQTWVGLK
ncbi:hypothetical protein [Streptacidiphilus sp. PAMC 29251]